MPVGAAGGAAGGAGNIRAGGAYFEVFANDKLSGQLDKIKMKVAAFVKSGLITRALFGTAQYDAKTGEYLGRVGGLVEKIKAARVPALAAGAAVSALLVGGINRHAEVAQMARRYQIPIALMSKLKHVADEAGVSVEEVMTDTTGRFSAAIAAAPAMNAAAAQKALETQREWTRALHDLQDATLPLIDLAQLAAKSLGGMAKAIKSLTDTSMARVEGEKPSDYYARMRAAGNTVLGAAALTGGESIRALFGGKANAGWADLAAKITGAGAAAGLPPMNVTALQAGVKGSFHTFGAMGQFGFGSGEIMKQTELLRQILNGEGRLPERMGKELAGALGMK